MGLKMAENRQSKALVIDYKKGVPVYEVNPSIPQQSQIARNKRAQIGTDKRGLIVDEGNGEILGHGGAIVYEWEEVDAERFVKMYLTGIKQAANLTKSGLTIFEIVYNQLRERPNSDTVQLSFYRVKQQLLDLAERTYHRGLRELLDREFLFRSPEDGTFFFNIRFMFNGDRLAFVKGYKLKDSNNRQGVLPLDGLSVERSSD